MPRVLALLVLILPWLGGCGTMADPREWFGGDDGPEPAELQDFEPLIRPAERWTVSVPAGDARFNRLVVAVGDQNLYVAGADGALEARDRETGKLVWRVETKLPLSAGPGLGEDLLVAGTVEGEVVAWDRTNGAERWRRQVGGQVLAVPAVGEGTVVVHTEDGNIHGLDAADGSPRWLYNHSTPVLTLHGTASPVISGTSVYCGLAGGKVVALDLETGRLEWERQVVVPAGRSEIERMVDVDADPLVDDGTVYAAAYQGAVAAMGEGSGKIFWKRKMSVYNNLAVDWRQLAASDDQGRLWSLDPESGAARWRVESLRYRKLSPPAILDDYVVVGDGEGYLHWFSAEDGRPAARNHLTGDAIVAQPVVRDGVLYVLAVDGTLTALGLPEEAPPPEE